MNLGFAVLVGGGAVRLVLQLEELIKAFHVEPV